MKWLNFLKPKKKAYHHVIDVTDDNFEEQVIKRSFKTFVMVDFWASWCGPCRQLGPVLERVAMEPESKFILAKLNTEHNPKVSSMFQISSIPAVKLFRNNQIVGQFTGLQMEHNIRRFVDESAETLPEIRIKRGQNPQKRLLQAKKVLKAGDGFMATMLLRDFPGEENDEVQALLPLAEFLWDVSDGDAITGNDTLDAHYIDALESLEAKNLDTAITHLKAAQKHGAPDASQLWLSALEQL